MIQFPCTCNHLFTVADDQTGDDIQCPDCGRLNTVPTAADLLLMNGDGTYKIDAPIGPEVPNAEREEELKRIFVNSRIDEYGREIDLRSHATPLDYQRVGVDPIEVLAEGNGPAAPKYDPETGELIRPMEIRKPEVAAHVRRPLPPGPRRPSRRVSFEQLSHVAPLQLMVDLFKPTNLIVMSFVVIAHIFFLVVLFITMFGLIFIFPVMIFTAIGIIAHFGNVIDETGPSSKDELPRPLRNVSWHEDIWGPCWAIATSAMICFGLPWFLLSAHISNDALKLGLVFALLAVGVVFFPAVLLIRTTSGHISNLRPDRIVGTIRACGGTYPLLVVQFLISVPCYFLGVSGIIACVHQLFSKLNGTWPIYERWYTAIPIFFLGVYLMHHFGWTLGHVYRVYHRMFPWEYQGAPTEFEAPKRGFAVLPPAVTKQPSAAPLQALPVTEGPTREERQAFAKKFQEQQMH